ncbi:aminodeoxychorismate synthase component I [Sphingomonas sp. ID0503]|uniref:aminodeoxychorismate synthase component I n=1 Tax=Sphingomonas sp. ID0503 TaxID=3399691 RepID=UPI003AFB7CAC
MAERAAMLPRDPAEPFVLLDDMSGDAGAVARLYRHPVEVVSGEFDAVLDRLRGTDLHAAGYLPFEGDGGWFGLFDRCEVLAAEDVPALLPDPSGAWAGAPRPLIDFEAYTAALTATQDWIASGDIYQANVTFPTELAICGHPLALYARLRPRGGGRWGGIVWTGETWLLSFSPELFFSLDGRTITARPMKGTARRDGDDAAAIARLSADPKQRAENLMIVDLMRNDLSRVAEAGSVRVPDLFTVETYPTVHQMTSTVKAMLLPGLHAADILAAAFPCGSVTGAPKKRAMEVIRAIETGPRGAYTGAIGHVAPDGSAAFNVAIRTLVIPNNDDKARLNLGSGIVADSIIAEEWRECHDKGAFVTLSMPALDLLETMRFDAMEGIQDLDRHLGRMKASADTLGIPFNRHDVRNEIQAATFRLRGERAVRLLVSATGKIAIETRPVPATPDMPVDVALAPLPVDPSDFRLRHKTTDRDFFRAAHKAAGTFEVVFIGADGVVHEGSFTNVFVARDGRLATPPLDRGVMPGVFRARLLDEGRAFEAELRPDDLADGFLIGNALRGLMRARLVAGAAKPGL